MKQGHFLCKHNFVVGYHTPSHMEALKALTVQEPSGVSSVLFF